MGIARDIVDCLGGLCVCVYDLSLSTFLFSGGHAMRGAGIYIGQRSGLLPVRKAVSLPGGMQSPGLPMLQLRPAVF